MSAPENLRDARLTRALESAPDAHLRPGAAVRQAVLKAAHDAVAAPPAKPAAPWLRFGRDAQDERRGRMPWNAAFATMLVAGFVTLLWQGQEVPDARLDSAAPAAEISGSAASAGRAPAPAPVAAPAAAPAAPKAVPLARDTERDRSHERERERRDDLPSRKAAAKEERATEAASGMSQGMPQEMAAPAADAAKAQPPAPAVAAAPAPPMAAPAAPPAPVPVPSALGELRARASVAQSAPGGGAAASMARREFAPALPAWTALRVPEGARGLPLARADAGNLPALLQALTVSPGGPAAAGQASDAFGPAAPLRVELMQGADLLGVLEVAGTSWRFTPADGARGVSGRADPQVLTALRAELQRLGLTRP